MDTSANSPQKLAERVLATIWTDAGSIAIIFLFIFSTLLMPPLSTHLRFASLWLAVSALLWHYLSLDAVVSLVFAAASVLFGMYFFTTTSTVGTSRSDQPQDSKQTPLPAAEKRDYTLRELREFDGNDPTKPILVSIKGIVYDITRGRDFYGAGGTYQVFSGREAAVALAKTSIDPKDVFSEGQEFTLKDLTAAERDSLDQWVAMFAAKYTVVGKIISVEEQQNAQQQQQQKKKSDSQKRD